MDLYVSETKTAVTIIILKATDEFVDLKYMYKGQILRLAIINLKATDNFIDLYVIRRDRY